MEGKGFLYQVSKIFILLVQGFLHSLWVIPLVLVVLMIVKWALLGLFAVSLEFIDLSWEIKKYFIYALVIAVIFLLFRLANQYIEKKDREW